MSDGGNNPLSGSFEFISDQVQQGAKATASAAGSVVTTAANQVAGSGGVSGQPQNPNLSGSFDLASGGGLPGGDLFAPDVQKANPVQQMFGNTKPLTQAAQAAIAREDRTYTQDELSKIQNIEQELRAMHKEKYYDPLMEKVEEERRNRQQHSQDAAPTPQAQQMGELAEQQKKDDDFATQLAATANERKGGHIG